MIKILVMCIILGVVPLLFGNLLTYKSDVGKKRNLSCEYVLGFLGMLALFQIMCVPMTYLRISFTTLTVLYTLLVVGICACSVYLYMKSVKWKLILDRRRYNVYELIYMGGFIALLFLQLYYAVFYDITYMSYDDFDYIATANLAIYDDGMFLSDMVTGVPMESFAPNRALNSYLIFVGYLAKISGYAVTTVAHTILPVFLLLLAYSAYYVIAKSLFKKCENRWIFMLLVAVLNIYGEYTKYSMTFRLLGPVWNGKGVFFSIVIPFILGIAPCIYSGEYQHVKGMYLLIIGIAASSLTLMGTIIPLIIFIVFSGFYFVIRRKVSYIYYMGWGCIAPIIFAIVYFVVR